MKCYNGIFYVLAELSKRHKKYQQFSNYLPDRNPRDRIEQLNPVSPPLLPISTFYFTSLGPLIVSMPRRFLLLVLPWSPIVSQVPVAVHTSIAAFTPLQRLKHQCCLRLKRCLRPALVLGTRCRRDSRSTLGDHSWKIEGSPCMLSVR